MLETTMPTNTYTITDVKVIDGDTFDCTIILGFDITLRQRIRLLNIDTPEIRTKDAEEKKFGLLAKRKLVEIVKQASSLHLKCETKREKFGRVLGELWADVKGEEESDLFNVNKFLCDNFYAVPYSGQSREEIAKQHIENRSKLDLPNDVI